MNTICQVILVRDLTQSVLRLQWYFEGEMTNEAFDNQLSFYPGWEVGTLSIVGVMQ